MCPSCGSWRWPTAAPVSGAQAAVAGTPGRLGLWRGPAASGRHSALLPPRLRLPSPRLSPPLLSLLVLTAAAVEKREVLRKELAALTPEELKFLVTRQLRCGGPAVHCTASSAGLPATSAGAHSAAWQGCAATPRRQQGCAPTSRARPRRLVSEDDPWVQESAFLSEVMVATYEHRRSQVGGRGPGTRRAVAGLCGAPAPAVGWHACSVC